jgi:hypothetical protein
MPARQSAVAAGLAVLACSAAILMPLRPEVAGENGLWVRVAGDSVIVHWLTAEPVPGVLSAASPTDTARFTTPPGYAHQAVLPPAPAGPVTLQYGSQGSLHTTQIDLVPPARDPAVLPAVDSLFILGDTHGDVAALTAGLRAAGLIDDSLRWSGGRSHLVFAGDLTDRGPDVLQLLWLVYRLEREAAAAGGGVHVLLGNHEIMVMLSDLRYVHPEETEVAELHGAGYEQLFDVRESLIGRWLAAKPAVIRVGDILIAHGGVAGETARLTLEAFDDTLAQYMGEELFHRWADTTFMPVIDSVSYQMRQDFFWGPRSVFWHRAYVQSDTLATELDRVLTAWGASTLVVGHTSVQQIEARYGGRLIATHTPRFGAELLLLAREDDGWARYRITEDAGPQRF